MAPRPLPPLNIAARSNQYVDRSDGLHLSRITHDILCKMDPERYDDREGGPNYMNFYAGLIFERALELAWLDKEFTSGQRPELIRPGEVTRDGVIGTPDAFDTKLFRPEEYKCTKKSCRQDISDVKFWHYWIQLKCYAYMTGANSGALYILHVNGNYSRDYSDPDSGYVIKGWYDEWSDTSLAETWNMILTHARRMKWLNP
jgi:hypothetical protein